MLTIGDLSNNGKPDVGLAEVAGSMVAIIPNARPDPCEPEFAGLSDRQSL